MTREPLVSPHAWWFHHWSTYQIFGWPGSNRPEVKLSQALTKAHVANERWCDSMGALSRAVRASTASLRYLIGELDKMEA